MSSPLSLISYYQNLLIKQYASLPNAQGTVASTVTPLLIPQQSQQTITFSLIPTSGTFILSYDGISTSTINWNDSASTIQTKLQTITALSQVTVTGSIATSLIINFVGVIPVAQILVVLNNTLLSTSTPVIITINETDVTLPLAVQNCYDLETAVGVQLDILGKYVGVVRTVNTPTQTITLNDADFLILIKFAILQNNSGSSLATIEYNLNQFFSGEFVVTDYKDMSMSYIFSQAIADQNIISVLLQERLIPKPMGVGISVINPVTIDTFFGYSTYESSGVNALVKGYNTYASVNTNWLFLEYGDIIH
jgi:hypothetical protein